MPVPDPIRKIAAEWTVKAEHDLLNARHTLKLGKTCPTDTVCFHAQQCIEKYLKALLVVCKKEFPKTHDVSLLMKAIPPYRRPEISPDELSAIADYATVTRYPGDYEPISLMEAKTAVRLAGRIRKEAKEILAR